MRDIAFVVYPDYSTTALAIVMAFEVANSVAGNKRYDLHFVSETGGNVRSSSGITVESEPFTNKPFDTLFVSGSTTPQPATAALLAFVRDAQKRHRRIAAIGTAAFLLADAGLLNGRRAAVHWQHAEEFQRRFPDVKLDDGRIFANDGQFWTTAGGAAGLDLALMLIENDLGGDCAKLVARELVVYHRRTGVNSQISPLLELAPKTDRIQTVLTYARNNLHKPLSVAELADVAHLSPRQFCRVFQAETGLSPAKAIENLRVEGARALIDESNHTIDVVARQTGFSDRDHLRRAFIRTFGQPPHVIRRNARNRTSRLGNVADAAPLVRRI